MGKLSRDVFNIKNLISYIQDVAQYILLFVLQIGIPSLITTLLLSNNGDSLSLSVFGVANTILTMMFLIIIKGIGETASLKIIKSKTNGDFS